MKINLGEHFEKTEVTKEQLQAINDLLGIEDSKVWKPGDNGTYYYFDNLGIIYETNWTDASTDSSKWILGNVFKTREEAEFARDKQIFLTQMKRDFIENSDEIDWNNIGQNKYILFYSKVNNKLDWSCINTLNYGRLHTTDLDWLKQYAKDNKEDIKKYYFDIKENK